LRDEFKDYPESSLYMVGKVDEAKEKFKPGKVESTDKSETSPKPGTSIQPKPEKAVAHES
jgi:F-type H+-transporting ATPase subunit beta